MFPILSDSNIRHLSCFLQQSSLSNFAIFHICLPSFRFLQDYWSSSNSLNGLLCIDLAVSLVPDFFPSAVFPPEAFFPCLTAVCCFPFAYSLSISIFVMFSFSVFCLIFSNSVVLPCYICTWVHAWINFLKQKYKDSFIFFSCRMKHRIRQLLIILFCVLKEFCFVG